MASNPYVNKVVYGNDTIMDISDTTAEEADVVAGKTFYKKSGARATGTADYYSPNDTAETAIDDADYFPYYDSSATGKRKSLWSNIKSVLKTYFDTLYQTILTFDNIPTASSDNPVKSGGVYSKMVHEIVRTGVTVSANGTVRIPASGEDSRISTANTCVVKPMCQSKSDGTPYKFKSCVVADGTGGGHVTITMAEAISNVAIGVEVINY